MSKVRSGARRRCGRRPGPWEQRERGRAERVSAVGPVGLGEGIGTAPGSLRQRCGAREGPWAREGSAGAEGSLWWPPWARSGSARSPRVRARSTSLVGIVKEVATAVALFAEKAE